MKNLTKKDRRKMQLQRHYDALARLAKECGLKAEGKKLSVALLKIERIAHEGAEAYCNGTIYRCLSKYGSGHFNFNADENAWERFSNMIEKQVQTLFNGKLPYLYINGDPRGYALKIDEEKGRELIEKTGLERDWGGYGLLAPEINGN